MKKQRGSFWTPLRAILSVFLIFVAVGLSLWLYFQGKNVAVLNPQGIIAREENHLIVFTLILSALVVIPVFIMLFTISWYFRESNYKAKYTPDVSGNRWFETLWWGIPIIVIGVLCVVTWVSTHRLDPYKAIDSNVKPLRVEAIALQWKWLFIYPDFHVASLNQLKIPAGTPVNFDITADAPMSSFWVPNLGGQIYAMPGMTSQLSLMADHAGTYRGANTGINGTGYASMTFNVEALPSQRDFYQWTQAVASTLQNKSLAWSQYVDLAKPKIDKDIVYYNLKDNNLYTEIINKYMAVGKERS